MARASLGMLGCSSRRKGEAEGDLAGTVSAPPAIDFSAESSDPKYDGEEHGVRRPSPPPPRSREWLGAGHQLYVLKITVSNKCLLIFFQRFCVAEFVVKRGLGSLPAHPPQGLVRLVVCGARAAWWDL